MRLSAKRVVLLLALLALPAAARSETYFGFTIGITNAPPPPRVVFHEAPPIVVVPATQVYVVDDDDCDYDVFRYNRYWYVFNGGYWYRSSSHRGPYRVVDARYVPRPILTVPRKHWRHHPHGGPPGQMKKHRDREVVVVKEKHRGHRH